MASSRILVSGVSGPIGATLLPSLKKQGYAVTRLVRGVASGADQVAWVPKQPVSPDSVSGFDAVIHLAGETIVGRWTASKKARILESRSISTRYLAEALAKAPQRPRVFISGSAVGYYGDREEESLREESPAGTGFLADVCRAWEAATDPASAAGIRTAQIRIGVVMSLDGGALPKMLLPFRLGVGGRIGSGRQWWSWVDVQDIVGSIHHILKTDLLEGPVNLVSPRPVTNAEFTQTLASVLHRPAIFPLPGFAARIMLGGMADELLLASQRVEPAKLIRSGYPFQSSDLRKTLDNLLHK